MNDDFYIGYAERAPAGVSRTVRRIIPVLVVLLGGVLYLTVRAQQFDSSAFEFGDVQEFEGVYRADPVPHLIQDDRSVLLLVGTGKFGASLAASSGEGVRLRGTRILRDDRIMIEVVASDEEVTSSAIMLPIPVRLGPVALSGEIVGSKCFLGVMNPAHGTVHRACARHCILGGVPPMIRPTDGGPAILATGFGPSRMASLAARPLHIRGTRWSLPGLEWIEVSETTEAAGS